MSDTERSPLVWPMHKPRTRPQDQKQNNSWKKTWSQYMEMLDKELHRMGVTRYVVTWNSAQLTNQVVNTRDPGVAVWFDRKGGDDFKWQDILGIENPWPTVSEIDAAYKRRVGPLHPDRHLNEPEFDTTPYVELTKAREYAIKFVRGTTELPKGFVIPSDQWKEPRQNLYAIIGTIQSLRRIERLGATQLFEGSLVGFAGVLAETVSQSKATINVV